ncbi:MAG: glycine--tRNA ligase subunit alpha [Rickettsiales bacterium]|nr:glycine--tRNA ligase subunit alpha [Rickettsiales bacterium]
MLTFQDIILRLQNFWMKKNCLLVQPYDLEMGAATFHPFTTLKAIGNAPWRAVFLQPCRRPSDGRFGKNPNRLQYYYQLQVIIKPSPVDSQELYLDSLKSISIDPNDNDIKFIEDDWESPTLGASGLGWEVQCNGMEISQFTYFQQIGGIECNPVSLELTYGLERLATYVQNVDSVFDIKLDKTGTKYGDLFLNNEEQFSSYNFNFADKSYLFETFKYYEENSNKLLENNLPLPAYELCIKASHSFNLLDARGLISVTERQSYILRIRSLVQKCCESIIGSA